MTCSLALDHGVHPPPLCAANKAKTDVATSVWFGVDVCYTEQVTMYIPRTFASDTAALSEKDAAFVCEAGEKGRDGARRQGDLSVYENSAEFPPCSLLWLSAIMCLPISSS